MRLNNKYADSQVKELLKTVIADQQEFRWNTEYIRRPLRDGVLDGSSIIVISGIRRCGKSTLLHQIRAEASEQDYYLNFDDERLVTFSVEHFQILEETFIEMYGPQKTWYVDEIQNVSGWERFVRRLHDRGHKVFVTGSNATMLSRELGTHLTGRYVQMELFPFSFREFLQFRGTDLDKLNVYKTEVMGLLNKHMNAYATEGGFPVYLREGQDTFLQSLYESILYRDVMVRNNLNNEREILELVFYLASNVSRLASYHSLTKVAGVKNPTTIKNYISFLEDTYLVFQVGKFDYSLKKQIQNPKKIYFIDTALIRKVGFSFSEERGRLLENIVFLALRRKHRDIYYHLQQKECDFLIQEGTTITTAIQVCDRVDDISTMERELNGLREAMEAYNLQEGTLIIRDGKEKQMEYPDGRMIRQVPVWKWLLEDDGNVN